jgi:hypothetical protein
MQWVHRKQHCDHPTPPHRVGHLQHHTKQQKDRDNMQDDVGKVMAASIQAVYLAVQHVRQRCERMPVARVGASEGDAYSLYR